MISSIKSNQNNEQFEILNINGIEIGNGNANPSFEAEGQNINITLESHNNSLINNLPIFCSEEKENLNNETEDELSQTIIEQLFYVKKIISQNKSLKKRFKIIKKKRGREKLNQVKINEYENEKVHDKNKSDNLLRKVQVHYISFIVQFLNEMIKILKYKQEFLKLNYKFKMNIKKVFVNSLKTKTIGEIICNPISIKYKKDLNYNKYVYEQLKKDKVLNKIFSENYSLFFKKFYYKSERIINLREYGLNEKLILSNEVKMYKDLIKNKEYVHKKYISNCVNHHFFPGSLFKIDEI